MKKAAICVSGHLRCWKVAFQSLKKHAVEILEKEGFRVDIYVSTWDTSGYRNLNWGGPELDLEEYKEVVSPIALEVEEFSRDMFIAYRTNQFAERRFWGLCGENTSTDAVSMWYKIHHAWLLMENKNYDLVIKTRPDLVLLEDIKVEECLDAINNNVLYIEKYTDKYGKYPIVQKDVLDHIAFGDYESMKYYTSVFPNIPMLIKQEDCVHCGEGFLHQHLSNNGGLKIKRTDLNYEINRS